MPKVRILVPVGAVDFAWIPGDEIDMSEEDAAKWADGYRGELVDAKKAVRPAPSTPEDAAPALETPESAAAEPVRRVGRPRKSAS